LEFNLRDSSQRVSAKMLNVYNQAGRISLVSDDLETTHRAFTQSRGGLDEPGLNGDGYGIDYIVRLPNQLFGPGTSLALRGHADRGGVDQHLESVTE
jgi:hypothetical protein